jgi:sulfite reductase (NADPH) flavoprotein alpha-component
MSAAMHEIVHTHGSMTDEAAGEYIGQLKDQHRYHRDVY